MSTKPLAGATIADFSAIYAGPIYAHMPSNGGADVIKVDTALKQLQDNQGPFKIRN